ERREPSLRGPQTRLEAHHAACQIALVGRGILPLHQLTKSQPRGKADDAPGNRAVKTPDPCSEQEAQSQTDKPHAVIPRAGSMQWTCPRLASLRHSHDSAGYRWARSTMFVSRIMLLPRLWAHSLRF